MKRTRLSIAGMVLSLSVSLMPTLASASPVKEPEWHFQTPYMARGRMIFVTRISRRSLRNAVVRSHQQYSPRGLRTEV